MSNRIKLINCDLILLQEIFKGDISLAKFLDVKVIEDWTEFGAVAFRYAMDKLEDAPGSNGWWTYLVVHLNDNALIGSCGYKGPPDSEGMVEIGYEITESYRNKGYATELVGMLENKAFKSNYVLKVRAETIADENASVAVLRKNGFVRIGEFENEDKWLIWRWEKSHN